ncbi:Palmitoyl-protein thioesterase 1 [Smittium mucronatum]|uniref:Palmitoyl-protein thioesterase 1 n=1 Tax=Smittium mucronatum TaxID=133383 RepID=A0A1R0GLU6_9FUNG|nr:Palmitoyl-protein thioesterase 1 [Smittium mucronatum]
MWHGMGDNCCDDLSMGRVKLLIQKEIPNIYIHSIKIGETPTSDRSFGFFGNINKHIDQACQQLQEDPALSNGYNGLGFSQGGLFMRALLQRCPYPKMKKLVTFGSPHAGVASPPSCKQGDFLCEAMRRSISNGVYSYYIQNSIIQAQYYKDPKRIDEYLKNSIFLPYINNEIEVNQTYIDRIKQLEKFVVIKFTLEKMIDPVESTWFGFYGKNGNPLPLQDTDLYKQDRLGLKYLDEKDKIDFLELETLHMQIPDHYLVEVASKYFKDPAPEIPDFFVQAYN